MQIEYFISVFSIDICKYVDFLKTQILQMIIEDAIFFVDVFL